MRLLNPQALELPLALHLLTSLVQFLRKIQGWHNLRNTSHMTLPHTSAASAWLDLSPLPQFFSSVPQTIRIISSRSLLLM